MSLRTPTKELCTTNKDSFALLIQAPSSEAQLM